jgi:hypothetical protein
MKKDNYFISLDGSRMARENIQKRSDFMKKHLKPGKKLLLKIILIWLLLTSTSHGFIETWVIIRKDFRIMSIP